MIGTIIVIIVTVMITIRVFQTLAELKNLRSAIWKIKRRDRK
jgi:hypothetical protein